MHKENNNHLHEDVKPIIFSGGDKSHDPEEILHEDMLYAIEYRGLYHDDILGDIRLEPKQSSSQKANLFQLELKRGLLDIYLNRKVEDLLHVIIRKRNVEKLI